MSAPSNIADIQKLLGPTSSTGPLGHSEQEAMIAKSLPALLELAKQGKLTEQQRKYVQAIVARQHRTQSQLQTQPQPQPQPQSSGQTPAPAGATQTASTSTTTTPTPTTTTNPALKRKSPGADPPLSSGVAQTPTSSTVPIAKDPGPQPWPNTSAPGRPTLTGGLPMGRMTGTPALLERVPEDLSLYGLGDVRVGPRKMSPADQSMRKSIQDLVSSIDPNVRVEPEVEDLLLDIADEFIDSVTNFACRLAKHRGGDTLEVRDLQLHLERNHNIRIPGFSSDETRMSSTAAGTAPSTKKTTQGTHMTLRSARLAAIQQAKKDTKLV